jgi:nitrate reductase assembly molybdenum cofactor insertion protein NarJ
MNVSADPKTQQLVAQAAAWRLASLLLERPRQEWKNELLKLCSEVADRKLLSSAKRAAQVSEEIYHRIFGPGGTASPREVSYCGFEDPGRVMADVAAFYQAFAFQPRREEAIDHIAVEAGFVSYLLLKEAYARTRGDAESVEVTNSARRRFVDDHIGQCARGMMNRLKEVPPYLRGVLSWLAEKK